VVRWPGIVPAGTVSNATIGLVDVLATVAEAIGAPLAQDAGEDSVSFLRVLRTPAAPFERRAALVAQSGDGSFAVREGRWKLCLAPGSGGLSAPRPDSPEARTLPPVQLYDLEADPRETLNVGAKHPDIVQRLTARLDAYRSAGRSR
jgi:arylsulfatase A-like enzyme